MSEITCRDREFWESRGISPEVRKRRGYKIWDVDGDEALEAVVEAYGDLESIDWLLQKACESGTGLVIPRHPPEAAYGRVWAEIRPDNPVTTRRVKHYHGFEPYGGPKCAEGEKRDIRRYSGRGIEVKPLKDDEPLYQWFLHNADAMLMHRWKWHEPPYGKMTEEKRRRHEAGEIPANDEDIHIHTIRAKYLFPPNPKEWETYWHMHGDEYRAHTHMGMTPAMCARHVANEHADADAATLARLLTEPHSYLYKPAKSPDDLRRHVKNNHKGALPDELDELLTKLHAHMVRRTVRGKGVNYAERLDVLDEAALEKIKRDPVVFFVIEGCLKADAVLSAGGAVFSVPSVSLWNTPHLHLFAEKYLRRKTVVIVPDMDWYTNSHVITQARLCEAFLKRHGVTAMVAAPPVKAGHKGVDDYLGADGSLATLDEIDRTIPDETIFDIATKRAEKFGNQAGMDRLIDTLRTLAKYADNKGELAISYEMFGQIMSGKGSLTKKEADAAAKRAKRGLDDCIEAGLIEKLAGDTETKKRWIPHSGGGGHYASCDEWVEPCMFRISKEALRGTDHHTSLGVKLPILQLLRLDVA